MVAGAGLRPAPDSPHATSRRPFFFEIASGAISHLSATSSLAFSGPRRPEAPAAKRAGNHYPRLGDGFQATPQVEPEAASSLPANFFARRALILEGSSQNRPLNGGTAPCETFRQELADARNDARCFLRFSCRSHYPRLRFGFAGVPRVDSPSTLENPQVRAASVFGLLEGCRQNRTVSGGMDNCAPSGPSHRRERAQIRSRAPSGRYLHALRQAKWAESSPRQPH